MKFKFKFYFKYSTEYYGKYSTEYYIALHGYMLLQNN